MDKGPTNEKSNVIPFEQYSRKPRTSHASNTFFEQGKAAEKEPNYTKATRFYIEALEANPNNVEAMVNLGRLFERERNLVEAAKLFRKATELNPGYSLAWYNLAITEEKTGHRELAIQYYKKAIGCKEPYVDAYYNLAILYEKIENPLQAIRLFKLFIKYAPANDPDIKTAQKSLQKVLARTVI